MKNTALMFILCFPVLSGIGQVQIDDPLGIVHKMFEGLHNGNGETILACFTEDARLLTIHERPDGTPFLDESNVTDFAEAVERPREESWQETLTDVHVQIDGRMASIWTDYIFHLGGEFHHCGVNAFQLFQDESGWKILQLTDTRHVNTCDSSKVIDQKGYETQVNEDVWIPFVRSYDKADASAFLAVHSPNVLRLTANGIRNASNYKKSIASSFERRIEAGRKLKIELYFSSRHVYSNSAYETGFYKIVENNVATAYGYFHVRLRKWNGRWMIEEDWDVDKVGSIEIDASFLEGLEMISSDSQG